VLVGAQRSFAVIHMKLARASNVLFLALMIELGNRERRLAIRPPDLAKTAHTDAFECSVTVHTVAESEPNNVIHGCHPLRSLPSEDSLGRPEIDLRAHQG